MAKGMAAASCISDVLLISTHLQSPGNLDVGAGSPHGAGRCGLEGAARVALLGIGRVLVLGTETAIALGSGAAAGETTGVEHGGGSGLDARGAVSKRVKVRLVDPATMQLEAVADRAARSDSSEPAM